MKTVNILGCGKLSPPLTASKRTAVSSLPTAKNSGTDSFYVAYSSVAVLFGAIKGKAFCLVRSRASDGWGFTSGSESKNRWWLRRFVDLRWSAVLGR